MAIQGEATVLEVLQTSVLFANFPEPVLAQLAEAGLAGRIDKGETIYEQGAPGESLAVILSGKVKIARIGASGRETVINFLGPGDLVGEIACLDGGERTARAVMLERGRIFVIRRDALMPALAESPDALMEVLGVLCEKLRATSEIVETHQRQMAARLAAGLLRLVDLQGKRTARGVELALGANQEELGSYLGLSRANTSREIARLARAGLLSHESRCLLVHDVEALQEIAEQSEE